MATHDNGLVAVHYGPCRLSALAGDGVPVEIVWAATNLREHQWHPSQTVVKDSARGLTARFRLSDTTEFKRWLLGYGRYATVLKPKPFAAEMCEELCAACDNYAGGASNKGPVGMS